MACDTFFLVEITDTMAAPGQQLLVKQLNADKQYSFPPDARQFGAHKFATNDCRNLGAIYQNNKIQFVHNTLDTATGFCGIYHGVMHNVSTATPTINGYIVNDTVLDIGYPNLSYIGNSSTDNSCIINFDHAAPAVNAGCSVLKSDGNGQYSPLVTVKNGSSYVNLLTGPVERWGDYSGTQRKYNDTDKVWMNGYYGYYSSGQRRHGTWIGEISLSPVGVSVAEMEAAQPTANVFPNPFTEIVTLDFELKQNKYLNFVLYDATGREVKVLMREYLKTGVQRFSFSLQPLAAGTYFLRVFSADGEIQISQKLIKN
jgi:hypothetical protein